MRKCGVNRYTTRSLIPTGIYRKGGDCRIGLVIPDPPPPPGLGDTGAAILQKARELSYITENLLRPVAILIKWNVSSVQPLSCFQEIIVFPGKHTCFKYAVATKFVTVQYTAFE
jgi:hypothetical protein